ncbi:MAG: SUMF1/EgtB/PvdO family nonheme iron enzyme, partial [Chloroflexota bacterium]
MDIGELAKQLAEFLKPALPALLTGAEIAVKAAIEAMGRDAWELAKKLWGKIWPKAKGKAAAEEAIQDAAQPQSDEDAQTSFRIQLKKLLDGDDELIKFVAENIAIAGDRSVMGRDFRDTMIATGNGNTMIGQLQVFLDSRYAKTPASQIPANELLLAYFRALAHECRQLPLGIVDPRFLKAAGEDSISLPGVYIDLDVQPPQREGERTKRTEEMLLERDRENRLPVLEALADKKLRRVVILGDPGSGKTSCLHYITYALSIIQLNDPDAPGLLPEEAPFKSLFPIRLVLREVAAQHIPTHAQKGSAEMIWNAIKADIASRLGSEAAASLFPVLQDQILKRPCFVMFDGLDEVTESDQKRERLIEAIDQFTAPLRKESYVLVTARPYAYADPKWHLSNYASITLLPFSDEQVSRFIERWYGSVREHMKWDAKAAQDRGGSLDQAINEKEYLFDLATRPLLLTLMATLHTSWGKLPEDRADLYDETVRLLLDRWQRWREVRDQQGNIVMEKSISVALSIEESKVRTALNELAHKVHTRQGAEIERQPAPADIRTEEVLAAFAPYLPDTVHPRIIIEYLETRAGLLIGRGNGIYSFPHRSFQEYLAACYLNDQPDPASEYCERIQADPTWWREVFLLGMGKMRRGGLGIAVAAVQTLVPASRAETKNITDKHWQASSLAGQALVEMRLLEDAANQSRYEVLLDHVRDWLKQTLEKGELTPRERAEAGDTLARLGDPRFDEQNWYLPNEPLLGFVHIPAGEFAMGTKKKDIQDLIKKYGGDKEWYEREVEQHTVSLPDFYLARYPVTVAQFKVFVEETKYDKVIENALNGIPNHPVRYVTWHDAIAYCNWLNEKLKLIASSQKVRNEAEQNFWQGIRDGKLTVTLPSEAEWEKAARGALTPGPS